ncbi:MAG: hypothetical protein ACK55Z_05445, partial [bacterium]
IHHCWFCLRLYFKADLVMFLLIFGAQHHFLEFRCFSFPKHCCLKNCYNFSTCWSGLLSFMQINCQIQTEEDFKEGYSYHQN